MKLTKARLKEIIKEELSKIAEEEDVTEAKRKKRPPEFKRGDKVRHKKYGTGTVAGPGAPTSKVGGRSVPVHWDDPDKLPDTKLPVQAIEDSLTKI